MGAADDFFGLKAPFRKRLGARARGMSAQAEAVDASGEPVARSLGAFRLHREARGKAE